MKDCHGYDNLSCYCYFDCYCFFFIGCVVVLVVFRAFWCRGVYGGGGIMIIGFIFYVTSFSIFFFFFFLFIFYFFVSRGGRFASREKIYGLVATKQENCYK